MPAMTFEQILHKAEAPTGCGVLVLRDGKVLTGTRIERASRGQICGPGGHIEAGETPEEAAKREAMEEFGITCEELVPLGVQNGGSRYGRSAVFLCSKFSGTPKTDEEEMTNPKWLTPGEIKEDNAFPPFRNSLKLLLEKKPVAKTLEEVLKFNPYHGPDGKFSSANGAHSFTVHTNSPAGQKAIANIKAKQKENAGGSGGSTGTGSNEPAMNSAQAIAAYQDYGYQAVNDGLRSGKKLEGKAKEISDGLDRAFETAEPTKYQQTLHRADGAATTAELWEKTGLTGKLPKSGDKFEVWMDHGKQIQDAMIGQTFTDKGFMSTSKDSEVAAEFISGNGYNPYGMEAVVHINVPKGLKVLDLGDDGYIAGSGEQETILPRGSSYKITYVDFNNATGSLSIYADLVTDNTKKSASYHPEQEGDQMDAFTIYKTDEDQRLVFGWASVAITVDGETLEDRQHDMIEPEDLEEAAYEYVLNFRDTGEEHLPGYRKKGKLVESCVFTPEKQRAMGIPEGILPVAWWIGFKIDDDDAWQRVKNGTYKMFSIEGKAEREEVEKADRTARTFDEVLKFNPYHGYHGYFSTADGATSMTAFTNSKAGQKAIANIKEKAKQQGSAIGGGSGSSSTSAGESKKPAEHKMAEGKDLLETMDPKKVGKMTTEEVLAAQGFDGKPKVVTSMDEFSQAVQDNGNIAARGISANDQMTLDAYVDQLKNGEFFVACDGGNAMGRGMYMATSWDGTNDYAADAVYTAWEYSVTKKHGAIINMTLDKSAKVITMSDLMDLAKADGVKLGSSNSKGPSGWAPVNSVREDIGAYAAAKGYDAIKENWSDYTVVLNRTKLTILDGFEGDLTDTPNGKKVIDAGAVPTF